MNRNELARLLYAVCLQFGSEPNHRALLVTTGELDGLYSGANIDLLAWLVVYAKRLGRIAIISNNLACHDRVARLAMQSGHRVRAFFDRDEAALWIAGAPYLPEPVRVRACA